jgi:hypothetical protein
MLHKETVAPATLELILTMQKDEIFKDFFLVGDTSLSLQIGHRISMDIDLFSRSPFNHIMILEYIKKNYNFSLQYMHTNMLKGIINGIFIDIITHDYDYVSTPIIEEGIKMLAKPNIAAMKVNAISGNGTRAKDFVDIYFLLKEYPFDEIISFYSTKYGKRNEFHAIKSLTYFNDMNTNDWPNLILEAKLTPSKMKKEICKQRDLYLKSV